MPPLTTEERPSTEKRVSRIEGAPTRLATKDDIAELRAEVLAELAASSNRRIKWMIALWSVAVIFLTIVYWLG